MGNLISLGNTQYAIPQQLMNDLQSYMQLGQSAWGGKVTFPQSAHFVVTNLPSPSASQNLLVLEMGMLNLRVMLRFERREGGAPSSANYLDLERTVT